MEIECSFPSDGRTSLLDAVRRALAGEGRPPSRARVRAWIEAGFVRVEGEVAREAGRIPAAGERVGLSVEEGAPSPRTAAAPSFPGVTVRHRDRYLAVLDQVLLPGEDVSRHEARLLDALEGAGTPRGAASLVPPLAPGVPGLVLAACTVKARDALEESFRTGRALLGVEALVDATGSTPAGAEILGEVAGALRVAASADARGVGPLLDAWAAGGVRVLEDAGAPSPDGRRRAVHAVRIRLRHPATGRARAWLSPPPWGAEVGCTPAGRGGDRA